MKTQQEIEYAKTLDKLNEEIIRKHEEAQIREEQVEQLQREQEALENRKSSHKQSNSSQ